MKKILAIPIFCLAAFSAGAQTMYDAINYADNNYYGTARSVALGNAMTAVGADLGSIGINPAGAAVAGYSQFTITPGLSISATQSSFAPSAYGTVTGTTPDSQTRFILPNCGFVMNMDTRRPYGLKNFTFGVTLNTVNVYNDRMSAGGTNSNTSMMGERAFYAEGIPASLIGSNNAYYDTDYAWRDILAYQSGMISTYGEGDDAYIGSSEILFDDGSIGLGGPIKQSVYRQRTGSRTNMDINFAFNFNDKLYIGANIGAPNLTYRESCNLMEEAVNVNDFAMIIDDVETAWVSARERYSLETDGSGIYGKFGLIWLPVQGLRLGAAIQTPTRYTIRERWMWDGICQFDGMKSTLYETPDGEYSYTLISPFSFNLGAAYTFANVAMLSLDWERMDFRSMRMHDSDRGYGFDSFSEDNDLIRRYAGVNDNIRFGVEYKVTPAFALRGGYSFKSYSEKSAGTRDLTHSGSLGFGYSSRGSFFLDCAVRYTKCPDQWYYPYEDYLEVRSPEICLSKNLMDVILTLGWRF